MSKRVLAPALRREETYSGMCRDVLLCVAALCIFSYVYFGVRPLVITLAAMATAVISETLCCLLARRPLSVLDGSAMVTGALIGMLTSPIAPFPIVIVASSFAVLAAKMPFGGLGRNLFNPAATGMALVTLLFSSSTFTYPNMDVSLPMDGTAAEVLTELSPAAILRAGGSTAYTWTDFLFGQFPGAIGATPILILCGCGAYLIIRRCASAWITLPYLATCALIAALFPRIAGTWQQSVMLELCSGYLLFTGIFLLNDPTTTPSHWLARILFGVLAGVLVMLMRHMGRFEEGACFAVLLCNVCTRALDVACWRLTHGLAHKIRRDRL